MTTVTAPVIGRPLELDMFADITTAPCVRLDGAGAVFDDADSPLTATQQAQVRIRMMTADDDQEQLCYQGLQAIAANAAFLAVGSPSSAQAVAQVQALTRQVDALIRLALQSYS